jgi:hypothetical protein
MLAVIIGRFMQNRYTGDVGDFGKYALLKALAKSDLRLGVIWYLNPDEEDNRDGRFVSYPRLRECDPVLYDQLAKIIRSGERRVSAIEQGSILPDGTLFYSAPITFRDLTSFQILERRARRASWLQDGVTLTAPADIVFLDPDNGLAGPSASPTAIGGQKYVFVEDIQPFISRGQSLIIYHHLSRQRGGLAVQVAEKVARLKATAAGALPLAMIYRRGSVRVYFVVPAPAHCQLLLKRSASFISSMWGRRGHFEIRTTDAHSPVVH